MRIKTLLVGGVSLVISIFLIITVYAIISQPLHDTLDKLNESGNSTLNSQNQNFFSSLLGRIWLAFLLAVLIMGGGAFVWFVMWVHKDEYEIDTRRYQGGW